MKLKIKLLPIATLFIITMLLIACEKEQNVQKNNYNVSGILVANGTPVKNASVDIDGLIQYKTQTDDQGNFYIPNVSKGEHNLNSKAELKNEVFIQKSYNIKLDNDLVFEELTLPNPVSISSLKIDSLTNEITLVWNKSYADDFREYKIYSHLNSGLDETTGTLEHVSTSADDTVFKRKILTSEEIFFRVFVLNEYGQLGGSNIDHVTYVNLNLLLGGDFEDSDLFNEHWNIEEGVVNIIDSNAYEGNACLLLQNDIIPDMEVAISLLKIPLKFQKDKEYEISFWYRVKGIGAVEHSQTLHFYYQQYEEIKLETNLPYELGLDFWTGEWLSFYYRELEDSGWLYYSKTFVPDSDSPVMFYIGGRIETLMFDNLKMKIIET